MEIDQKYEYNIIKPQINFNDLNKPSIYIILDELHKIFNKKPESFDKLKSEKMKQLYKLILNEPIVLTNKYQIFTPFIYVLFCHENVIDSLFKMFFSLPKELQQMFLVKPWDYTSLYNFTPLHFAIYFNKTNMVKKLLRKNVLQNEIDYYGNTPLHLICILNRIGMIDILIYYRSVDVNIINNLGESPLYIAIMSGYTDIVKKLLEHNADTSYILNGRTIDFYKIMKNDDQLPTNKRAIKDDIKGYLVQAKVSRERRIRSLSRDKNQDLRREILQQHSKLCGKIDNIIDINLLYNLANIVGVQNPISYNRQQLCKKIATKILIKSHTKDYSI